MASLSYIIRALSEVKGMVNAMFELSQLEQLVTISKYKTLSEAAKQLYITQPALSRSMQKLEQELGVPLFDHSKNRIMLNETGELAVTCAKTLLTQADDMEDRLRIFHRSLHTISIGSCALAPIWYLIPHLSEHFPNVTISSELNSETEDLIKNLNEGVYKLIVTLNPVAQNGILSTPYFKESLYLAVPEGHELYGIEELYLRDLKNMTLLMNAKIGFWTSLCEREMVNPRFISQENLEDFLTLAKTTSLPHFVTDISLARFQHATYQKLIHILDEQANVTYYCSCLEKNKTYLPSPLPHISQMAKNGI